MEFTLSREEKIALLQLARGAIGQSLGQAESSPPLETPSLLQHYGVFVTLHKNAKLRGCIGYITATKSLIQLVADAAQASAFQDTRFGPLRKEEWDSIEIEISVLSPLKPLDTIEEIEVGKHGIVMKQGYRSGLLLPQVAVEYNWDRETFLTNTCYKAGLDGNCWRDPDTEIEIFSAIVFNEKELGLRER
jgi:AmmeMemoRadiSam system protein A